MATTIDGASGRPPVSGLLRALQFGDSMLPVGSFSFSNGLESAVQQGVVHDLEGLRRFVRDALRQAGSSDGVALLEAFRGAEAGDAARVARADHAVLNRKLNEESRTMTTRMGRKLAELAVKVVGAAGVGEWLAAVKRGETPGTYPVAQALVFEALGLSERDAFDAQQYGLASLMLGASLRLMRVSHLDAQAALFEINADSAEAYERASVMRVDEMSAFAPVLDVMAALHVRATVRMFMN